MTTDTELRRLAEAATPGEWRFERHVLYPSEWVGNITAYLPREPNQIQQIVTITCQRKAANADANALYMEAAQPKTVLSLLDRLAAKDARIAELERALSEARAKERTLGAREVCAHIDPRFEGGVICNMEITNPYCKACDTPECPWSEGLTIEQVITQILAAQQPTPEAGT